jgi:hypothetical protein
MEMHPRPASVRARPGNSWSSLRARVRLALPIGPGGLRGWWERLLRLAGRSVNDDLPAALCQPTDLRVLNCRMRIGREAKGDTWQSVLIVEICGTIHAPADGHAVGLRISVDDVTDSASEPLSALNRPKHGPLNPSSYFVHQSDMGRLCQHTMVLEDWMTVAQLAPERFVLPRGGARGERHRV